MSLKTRWEAWSNMEKPGDYLYGLYIANALEKECKPLFDIMDTPQDPKNHEEGVAGIHSIMVVNEGAKLCSENNIIGQQRKYILHSCLLHDSGKVSTTRWNDKKQKYTSYGHSEISAKISYNWLTQVLDWSDFDAKVVSSLCLNHMVHCRNIHDHNEKNIRKFMENLKESGTCFQELYWLMQADCLGRRPQKEIRNDSMKYLITQIEKFYPGQKIE